MRQGINLVGVSILMGLALLAAVVVTGRVTERGRRHQPSIVLLVLDTVRADHLSALGYDRPTSPHLDRVRDEGCLFTHAYAPAPWTLPVHASLFTGLRPLEHGCHWEHRFLTESQETLAERLRARGYETGGFSANVNVSHFFNLDQGFETFVEIWRERRRQAGATDSEITNQEVLKWLDGLSGDRPFFLFVNYMDAHLPYRPPESERNLFYGAGRTEPDAAARTDLLDLVLTGKVKLTSDVRDELVDLYDGEIAYVDRMVGELLDGLEKRGLLEESLLVITSDHGENLGEDGLVDHQLSLSERLLRVPIFMRWPGRIEAGRKIDEMVDQVDLYDSLLEAADGGSSPEDVFLAVPESDRVLLASSMRPLEIEERLGRQIDRPDLFVRRTAVRVRDRGRELKLLTTSAGERLVFDVSRDPEEQSPLDEPWTADRLASLMAGRRERLQRFDESDPVGTPGEALGNEARRILESLGYVSGSPLPRGVGVHAAEHLHLGFLRLTEGDDEAAARDFELACALAPDRPEARFGLARSLETIDPDRAQGLYEEYLRLSDGLAGEERRCQVARERLETLRAR